MNKDNLKNKLEDKGLKYLRKVKKERPSPPMPYWNFDAPGFPKAYINEDFNLNYKVKK